MCGAGIFCFRNIKGAFPEKRKGKKVTHTMRGSKKDNYKRR